MTIVCPECQAIYRIDPSRVPVGGLRARCTACGAVLAIGLSTSLPEWAPGPVDPSVRSASDAAAAPEDSDWFAGEATREGAWSPTAPAVTPTNSEVPDADPWAGLWGDDAAAAPKARPAASHPGPAIAPRRRSEGSSGSA